MAVVLGLVCGYLLGVVTIIILAAFAEEEEKDEKGV